MKLVKALLERGNASDAAGIAAVVALVIGAIIVIALVVGMLAYFLLSVAFPSYLAFDWHWWRFLAVGLIMVVLM